MFWTIPWQTGSKMIYQVILNIYLLALIVVGIFSLEAIFLGYKYWQGRKRKTSDPESDYFPKVTVQLPIYNELYVADKNKLRIESGVASINYPQEELSWQEKVLIVSFIFCIATHGYKYFNKIAINYEAYNEENDPTSLKLTSLSLNVLSE